nr:nickel-dependent lactate racemase [Geobacter sp. DSM 9736]
MELKYGTTASPLGMSPDKIRGVIRYDQPPPEESPEQIISASLDECSSLLSSFRPGQKVVIITSDITRYTGSEIYLPLLVERLNACGISDEEIEIVVALGIHRKQTEAEHRKIVGSLYGRIAVSDHECDDPGKLLYLGRTSAGLEIEINRKVAEADRVIATGTIGYHYFAGYGGGRKSILPGTGSRKSCMASHFAVLNPGEGTGKHPFAATGILDGNPVNQALEEACAMVEPAFILNTVLSPDKRIIAAFSGHWRAAHRAGCAYYAERFSYPLREKADLVLVSCGGYPKDINFIQAHKSMEYASQALKDGGVMVLLAQCRDGYGNSTFFNWFRFHDLREFEAELRRNYEINGQTAYSTLQKAKRFQVVLVSDLPAEEVNAMGMIPQHSLDKALEVAEGLLPADYSAYVIPEGGTVLPVVG